LSQHHVAQFALGLVNHQEPGVATTCTSFCRPSAEKAIGCLLGVVAVETTGFTTTCATDWRAGDPCAISSATEASTH
jgi:hypothetical protein